MALTEVQTAKLTIEIDRLTRKADDFENEARRQDSDFFATAQVYGSELAGSSGTGHLYREAAELRELAAFLKNVKSGAIPLSYFESYKRDLKTTERYVQYYTEQMDQLKVAIAKFEILHRILSS